MSNNTKQTHDGFTCPQDCNCLERQDPDIYYVQPSHLDTRTKTNEQVWANVKPPAGLDKTSPTVSARKAEIVRGQLAGNIISKEDHAAATSPKKDIASKSVLYRSMSKKSTHSKVSFASNR